MYIEIIKFLPDEILVYLRKSRTDDPTLTVEEVLQKHKMIALEWIEKNLDAPIPKENWYSEIGSGGESIENRPEFQKVLKRIEDKKIRAIFVSEVSRLGRPDLEEIGRISKLLRYTSTYVVTPSAFYKWNAIQTFDICVLALHMEHKQSYQA